MLLRLEDYDVKQTVVIKQFVTFLGSTKCQEAEQSAITAACSINRLLCIIETECICCSEQSECSNNFSP
jgi:hypothetical protein